MYRAAGKLAEIDSSFTGEILVVGDIHGDLEAFRYACGVFEKSDDPLMIFLGDYADRGPDGLEVIEELTALMHEESERVIALKGNHEDYRDGRAGFSPCDLPREVWEKRGISWEEYYPFLKEIFLDRLFISAVMPRLALFVHGGVSSAIRSVRDLIDPGPSVEEVILWSDPGNVVGECPNFRGAGVVFGEDVTRKVLDSLSVRYLVRSHEPRKALRGPCVEHEGRVITTSCTSIYGGVPFVLRFYRDGEEWFFSMIRVNL